MDNNIVDIDKREQSDILKLMEIFQCADIPLNTSTQNYSGGEKLRISLVRAFNLGEIVVINSNLQSLDRTMRKSVQENIRNLVDRSFEDISQNYTVFIR